MKSKKAKKKKKTGDALQNEKGQKRQGSCVGFQDGRQHQSEVLSAVAGCLGPTGSGKKVESWGKIRCQKVVRARVGLF
jgi:hypothetical protein